MSDFTSPTRANHPAPLTLAPPDSDLRVEFCWRDDRFVQRLFVGDAHPLGNSVEGSADEQWPPSPPIQQLSLETINGKSVILGVGAAGKNHWSISVETFADDHATGMKFDLACRRTSDPIYLGSTYTLDKNIIVEPLAPSTIDRDERTVSIRPGFSRPGFSRSSSNRDEPTIQWGYRLCLLR